MEEEEKWVPATAWRRRSRGCQWRKRIGKMSKGEGVGFGINGDGGVEGEDEHQNGLVGNNIAY